ncbi:MAG: ATP-binding cassette domain-containing protein [Cyanobacteria bacterium P01_H01_bin.15]
MTAIAVRELSKYYPVALKAPGLKGTLTHFFKRQYREIKAVQQITFQIQPGEVVGFLGPNGAGKTTTLKMLSGLIHPSDGQVQVAGHTPFSRERPFLRKIGLVMGQKQQLLWDLPALDSFRINAAVYDLTDKQFQTRLGELSEMLSLGAKLTQPVRKLSLGERMKAELLAALLHHPQILFLDEPTLGLDVNAQAAVREFLQTYNERFGATILLTSHYMADITALCDRVLMIAQGQLVYDGELTSLLAQYAPDRLVTVELEKPVSPSALEKFGPLENLDGREASYLVPRVQLTDRVAQLLAQLPVQDLIITEPPVEDVIARLFAARSV